ncbi:FAD-dependent oxidoreductase [Streptomyces platensis]|uniref:FAD-dependent oxidoreductase n=1 Tax=Streptomyces platensis TaxID=58346 RepID=UPI001F2B4832|nr:FAD-dependent oxidoreductase [Streptomyces platensis]MCF3145201.1 FAD-dependent oxidoreductase [Streptomyces platensis]
MVEEQVVDSVSVIVAGAGPVGLVAACELASAGMDVLVLERRADPDPVLKAGSVGPLAIEALDRLGLRDELVAAERATMAGYEQMAEQTGGRAPGEADALTKAQREHFAGLEKIEASRRSEPERRRMRVPQPVLVEILARKAESLGVRVLRAHTVTSVRQEPEGVVVQSETSSGRREFRARYLLGCDGAASAVRTAAGYDFPGTDATMLGRQGVVELADPQQIPPGIHDVENGVLVYGLGVDRVAALEFVPPAAKDLGPLDQQELHDAVQRVSGIDLDIVEMKTGGRFTDEARHVPDYRKGRVFLAGDAARIHAPVGGQGLNYGLIEAVNIAWKLAARLHGWGTEELLNTYTAERHPQARRLLENTRAQIALMRPDTHSRALRELFADLLDLDEVNAFIGDMMAALDTRYDLGDSDPLVGTLCGDFELKLSEEVAAPAARRLADLPHDGQGLLLSFDAAVPLGALARPWQGRVRSIDSAVGRDDVRAMLLRPDGCIAWVLRPGDELDEGSLTSALHRWFGEPA